MRRLKNDVKKISKSEDMERIQAISEASDRGMPFWQRIKDVNPDSLPEDERKDLNAAVDGWGWVKRWLLSFYPKVSNREFKDVMRRMEYWRQSMRKALNNLKLMREAKRVSLTLPTPAFRESKLVKSLLKKAAQGGNGDDDDDDDDESGEDSSESGSESSSSSSSASAVCKLLDEEEAAKVMIESKSKLAKPPSKEPPSKVAPVKPKAVPLASKTTASTKALKDKKEESIREAIKPKAKEDKTGAKSKSKSSTTATAGQPTLSIPLVYVNKADLLYNAGRYFEQSA